MQTCACHGCKFNEDVNGNPDAVAHCKKGARLYKKMVHGKTKEIRDQYTKLYLEHTRKVWPRWWFADLEEEGDGKGELITSYAVAAPSEAEQDSDDETEEEAPAPTMGLAMMNLPA